MGGSSVAAELGFDPKSAELQWWAVAKVAAFAVVPPERLTKAQLDTGREQLIAATRSCDPDHPVRGRLADDVAARRRGDVVQRRVIDSPPRKRRWDKSAVRAQQWAAAPPRYAPTFEGTSSRCASRSDRRRWSASRRSCASSPCWLTTHAPEVTAVVICGALTSRATSATSPRGPRCVAGDSRNRAGRAARHTAGVPRATERVGW